jgi:glycosyltransferase involved in cell wall biosynthesis
MEQLKALSKELQVESSVVFYGEQANPYRYIRNADFLLIPSHHEAAPLVIDEALCLGVPVLSTATTSSEDMILNRNAGWVCDNSQEAINQKLYAIAANQDEIQRVKKAISLRGVPDNSIAIRMLQEII